MNQINIHLAHNLLLLRKHLGLSQKKVAAILQVDRSTYSYYELGRTEPPLQKLVLLSDFYGISLDTMLFCDPSELRFFLLTTTPTIDSIKEERPAE